MKALIVVDVQSDFLPGGALAVPEGDLVVPVINTLMPTYELVIATQDWHPANHSSFAANHPGKRVGDVIDLHGLRQILWPVHCVQGRPGADFAPGLDVVQFAQVFQKGVDPKVDSYSGFFDNGHRRDTGLRAYLAERGVMAVDVVGLATDYCVKATAIDAREAGFAVRVLLQGCRGVNLKPGDVASAVTELHAKGVEIVP